MLAVEVCDHSGYIVDIIIFFVLTFQAFNIRSSRVFQTYVHHSMYSTLIKHICTVTGHTDAKLNKICRNLSQTALKDLGINTEFR